LANPRHKSNPPGGLANDAEDHAPGSLAIRWLQAVSVYLHDLPGEWVVTVTGRKTRKFSVLDAAIRLNALALKGSGVLRARDNGSSVGTPFSTRQLMDALEVSTGKAVALLRWFEDTGWLDTNKSTSPWERTLTIPYQTAKQAPQGWPLKAAEAPDPEDIKL
jgi:hypothetical protein